MGHKKDGKHRVRKRILLEIECVQAEKVEGIKTEDGGPEHARKDKKVTPALLFRQISVSGIQSILQRT